MTLMELQDKLGEQIELLSDKKTPYEAKKKLADVAAVISSLAKQMAEKPMSTAVTSTRIFFFIFFPPLS